MLNQTRINGLLKYMEQIGLEQMVIRNPVLIRYMLGYMPRGGDRATILYVSKTNGIKLIVNEL
ncbi:MAG: aminopeptidase P family N-terminal domain-containing protein, partial [Clostridia bacterium]|nr:aminopeptidase P family N-terminal domain-containing protein [Clostridia bacterium]